tara:strand:- start:4314 stop:5339 length:1026 start_codon:yes stop_codon:yes gene_type:complete
MSKTALITGISGQDGAYLSKFLLEKGYRVIGGDRRTARGSLWRLEELGIVDDIEITDCELAEFTNIFRIIEKYDLNEVYNLAAQSFVGVSFEVPTMTGDITGLGVCRLLEAIRQVAPEIKFYQASTSELFGKAKEFPQSEETQFHPRSPYAVAKLYGHWMTVNYRESYNIFATNGILFNHESPLRGKEFVTRKITMSFARIKNGLQDILELGNLEPKRDWGFAGDFVEAMWLILQKDQPDDYVIATGENHSVKEFVEASASCIGFDIIWEGKAEETVGIDRKSGKTIVKVNPEFYRPAEVEQLIGDATKAQQQLGWSPNMSFEELVQLMVESDLARVKKSF